MDDSFDRIADINAINAAKVDSAAWDALSQRERDTKLSFRDGQARPLPLPCIRRAAPDAVRPCMGCCLRAV